MDFSERLDLMQQGPMHLRFFLQPAIALLLGIQAGRLDAKAGTPPYVLRLLTGDNQRGALREGLKQLVVPLCLAIVIDLVVSVMLFGRVFPVSSLLVGGLLVGLPYAAARGITNRLSTHVSTSAERHA